MKRTKMTYEGFCDSLYVVEMREGSLWCEDAEGAYHYDGNSGKYCLDGHNSRDFTECSDKVLDYLDRLYETFVRYLQQQQQGDSK